MNVRHLSIATIAATLLAPALSMAESPWVQANNNSGFRYQPQAVESTRDAQGVQGRSIGAPVSPQVLLREGPPLDTFPAAPSGKTREQVRSETLNLSPVEKQQLQQSQRGG